jgi:N utilization substance protein B
VTAGAERRAADRPPRESRHHARETALQMLYQWEVGRLPMADVQATFWIQAPEDVAPLSDELRRFATSLADGVTAHVAQLDPVIGQAAEHWRLERMNVMDRLILRLAVHEFLHEPEVPGKVVINEALELARTFSGDESVGFINGILDAVRKTLGRE